jgi:RNA polymerase sigma-70 factor, ECF subfamily
MKSTQPGRTEVVSWPVGPDLRARTGRETAGMIGAATEKERLFQGFLENKKTVFWICLGYTRDFVEAEELTQEVFFKAWTKLDSVKCPEKPREWLCRVARSACLDHLKKMRLRNIFRGNLGSYPQDERTPETRAVYRDEIKLLKAAIQALPKKLRDTFILRGYGGLSYREISALLEIKEGTVMSRLSEARERIRSCMKGQIHG